MYRLDLMSPCSFPGQYPNAARHYSGFHTRPYYCAVMADGLEVYWHYEGGTGRPVVLHTKKGG